MPQVYRELIEKIYANNHLEIELARTEKPKNDTRITYELSRYTQSGTLVIDWISDDFDHMIRHYLHILYKKHVEMIFADINLMKCGCIDEAMRVLLEEGFVFSGVLFYRKGEDDYVRLQMPNSDNVETKRIVCHTEFCRDLLQKISAELDAF